MGIYLPKVDTDTDFQSQQVNTLETDPWEMLKASYKFDLFSGTFAGSVFKYNELRRLGESGEKLSPEQLNKEYGDEDFRFDREYTRAQAALLLDRKLEERHRNRLWEGSGGWATAAGFAGSFGAGASDPTNWLLGAAVAPIRGMQAFAFARGLQASANVGKRMAGSFVLSGTEGLIGGALIEPVIFGSNNAYMEDYGMADALLNVAFGGIVEGGLHATATGVAQLSKSTWRGLHSVAGKVPAWLGGRTIQTHENSLYRAAEQMITGENVDVSDIHMQDPNVQGTTSIASADKTDAEFDPDLNNYHVTELDDDLDVLMDRPADNLLRTAEDKQAALYHIANDKSTDLMFDEKGFITTIKGNRLNQAQDPGGVYLNKVKIDLVDPAASWDFVTMGWSQKDFFKTSKLNNNGFSPWKKGEYSGFGQNSLGIVLVEPDGRIWVKSGKTGLEAYVHSDGYKGEAYEGITDDGLPKLHAHLVQTTGMIGTPLHYVGADNGISVAVYQRAGGLPENMELLTPEAFKAFAATESGYLNDIAFTLLGQSENWGSFQGGTKAEKALLVKSSPELKKAIKADRTVKFADDVGDPKDVPVIQFENLYPTGVENLGSNEGGLYEAPDGSQWYVKFPKNQEHARAELAAHMLYKKAYTAFLSSEYVPSVAIVKKADGTQGIGSKWQGETTPVSPTNIVATVLKGGTESWALDSLMRTWVFDAWINNWDWIGNAPTYNIVKNASGHYHKIDFGGSLDFRAQGEKKPKVEGSVPEIATFLDKNRETGLMLRAILDIDPNDAIEGRILEKIGNESALGIDMVIRLEEEDIREAFIQAGMSKAEVNRYTSLLLARQLAIRQMFPEIDSLSAGLHGKDAFIKHSDATKILKSHAKKVEGAYTPAQKASISNYQGDSTGLNHALFKSVVDKDYDTYAKHYAQQIGDLDNAAEKFVFEKPTQVWRWLGSSKLDIPVETWIKAVENHDGYIHPGYISTSTGPYNGHHHNYDVAFIIDVRPGVHGFIPHAVNSSSFPNEVEIVLERDLVLWAKGASEKIRPDGSKYTEIRFEVMPKDDFSMTPYDMLSLSHKIAQSKDPIDAGYKTFDVETNKLIDAYIHKVYDDSTPIPVLTEVIETKTPLMKEIEKEIANLEATIKELDPEAKGLDAEIEAADQIITKTEKVVKAIKQAWTCFKGH